MYEAVQGRFMSSRMGRPPEHIDGKLVARSNWHPLDGLGASVRERYVERYIPWAGDMGRRGVPTAGIDRVTWLQLVVDCRDGRARSRRARRSLRLAHERSETCSRGTHVVPALCRPAVAPNKTRRKRGAEARIRTADLLITNQLLYH